MTAGRPDDAAVFTVDLPRWAGCADAIADQARRCGIDRHAGRRTWC